MSKPIHDAIAGNELNGITTPPKHRSADDNLGQTFVNPIVSTVRDPLASEGQRLGRYQILKKLGQGGMGAVYHAQDSLTGQEVAIKVLAPGCLSNTDSLRRFEKEARLLEAAKSPHVANLLDVGVEGETRFLVMEFVRGGDLRQWMKTQGRLDEATVLDIMSDLCRSLVSAHARGMVHRDVKPENILLDEANDGSRPILKLTDFGLARHIDQSESLQLTQTGALLGTPYYMSPEQFNGTHEVSPSTDVYAMGVTFFELLTDCRPFAATDAIQLATAHCFEAPPDVRKLNSLISDATSDLVRRMLAKQPGQRPPDSSSVLEEILRLQNGDTSQFVVHPVLPNHNSASIIAADFEWNLNSSPAVLWPFVSNTDRFNQAVGFQPVNYETITETDGRLRKFGHFKLATMTMRWEEHPFEWVEGQRFSVLREFSAGPFVWFMSDVELVPRTEGGTTLKHHVKIEPRGVLGRIIARHELGPKCQRKFETIYQHIDNTVHRRTSTRQVSDPFQEPPGLKRIQRERLEQRLDKLTSHNVSSEIIDVVRKLVVNSSEQDLARLRPLAVAHRFNLPELEVVEAFLQAVPIGLLTLHWDIICPTCRLASGTKATLREIEQHGNCSACQTKFDIEFSSSLELIFRVHPEIRSSEARIYCAGGPGNFPHIVAQVRLLPGEKLTLPLTLESGSYVARGPNLPYAIPINVDTLTGPRQGRLNCVPGMNRSPVAMLRAGNQNLIVENNFPSEQLIRIERTVRRSDTLTAARVSTLPLFRNLFPNQTISPGMLVEIATTNFLAIHLKDLDNTLSQLGDARTYVLVQDFWQIIERQILRNGGSVLERSAEILLASFSDPVVAIDTIRGLNAVLNEDRPQHQWSLSCGLHRGSAIVTGDQQDVRYFGATINRTIQLAKDANSEQLWLTRDVSSDPGVIKAICEQLKGNEAESIAKWMSLVEI